MKSRFVTRVVSVTTVCMVILACRASSFGAEKTLKIFILAGQSNMTGYCGIMPLTNIANYDELEDKTLRELDKRLCELVFPGAGAIARNQELRARIYRANKAKEANNLRIAAARKAEDQDTVAALEAENEEADARVKEWAADLQVAVSKRVYIAPDGRYGHKPGPLKFGYGRHKGYMGPEYGFGLSMEKKLDAPILLIKVAQDGASLAYNYRPTSSGPYIGSNGKKEEPAEAGSDYRRTVAFTREVLADLKTYHPEYDPEAGYELTGFVWFQGWSDSKPHHGNQYVENMTNMINDLRKELNAPGMLVVSGSPSFTRTEEAYEANLVVKAQREVGRMPEFSGTVAIVESLPFYDHPIWDLYTKWRANYPEWHQVGSHVACHYLGSGRFFVRLGDALAGAMYGMME